MKTSNKSKKTIQSFGDEWTKFDQSTLQKNELDTITSRYFDIFRNFMNICNYFANLITIF